MSRPENSVSSAADESSIFCEICPETKQSDQKFAAGECAHSFCTSCISQHLKTRIEENITAVTCPGVNCSALLELNPCRPFLPKSVLDLWERVLCEKFLQDSGRIYCPFKDCSASLLIYDSRKVIKESECPYCHRLFCANCGVAWHPGVDCEEFQRLNEDERGREDLMVKELAKEKQSSRGSSN